MRSRPSVAKPRESAPIQREAITPIEHSAYHGMGRGKEGAFVGAGSVLGGMPSGFAEPGERERCTSISRVSPRCRPG